MSDVRRELLRQQQDAIQLLTIAAFAENTAAVAAEGSAEVDASRRVRVIEAVTNALVSAGAPQAGASQLAQRQVDQYLAFLSPVRAGWSSGAAASVRDGVLQSAAAIPKELWGDVRVSVRLVGDGA